jgi:molecular chaperone GrpE
MSAAPDGKSAESQRPAGPVAGQGSSSSQAAGEDPSPAPPAGATAAGDVETPSAGAQDSDASASPAGDQSERGANASPSPDAAHEVEADIERLLVDTQRERDEYLDLAKRTKADFENYRKRMTAEAAAALVRGKAEVLRDVLPVLDDLERAIQAAGLDPEGDSEDGLAHGVLLVFRSLRDSLVRNGVEAVDPTGERFDPNLHEALSTQAADGAEAGTVVETMQKGYRLGEQLIRPARVVVAE